MSTPSLPAIPPYVRALLGFAAPLCAAFGATTPYPWGWVLAALAVACGLASGVAVKVPSWLAGRPVLRGSFPLALAPLVGLLVDASASAPDSLERGACLLGAVVLAGLAGVPLPQPGRKPAAQVVADHATSTAEALGRTLKQE